MVWVCDRAKGRAWRPCVHGREPGAALCAFPAFLGQAPCGAFSLVLSFPLCFSFRCWAFHLRLIFFAVRFFSRFSRPLVVTLRGGDRLVTLEMAGCVQVVGLSVVMRGLGCGTA